MRNIDFLSIRQISMDKPMRNIEKTDGTVAHHASALNLFLSEPTEGCLCTSL